ncbi:MAG: hypothetical protein V8Q71_05335 [Bacilli bacterium]|jgi:K+ transporter
MADVILEKIKSNNKEIKKIKVRMAIFKYLEITTLISGGIYLLENIIKNSVYGLLNSIIVTTISSIPYGLMAYGARYLYKKNRVKRISLENENKELNNSDDYSNDNEKEKAKEEIKEDVKKETVIKEENKIKEETVSKEEVITENKEKNINEEKKLEKPTISEQRINLEELRNQVMNLEIEQGYDEDKKYVKAK